MKLSRNDIKKPANLGVRECVLSNCSSIIINAFTETPSIWSRLERDLKYRITGEREREKKGIEKKLAGNRFIFGTPNPLKSQSFYKKMFSSHF